MSPRATRSIAWVLAGASIATIAAGLVIGLATGTISDVADTGVVFATVFGVAILAFSLMGLLISTKQPSNPIGWLFGAIGLAFGLTLIAGIYVEASSLPGRQWAAWLVTWTAGGIFPLIVLVMLVFPDGELLSRRWRIAVWIDVAAAAFITVGLAFTPGPILDQPGLVNPVGIEALRGSILDSGGLGWLFLPLAVLAACVSLILRYRRSRGVERQQLKWLALAAACVLVGFVAQEATYETRFADIGIIAIQLAVVTLPLATAAAILRYRLYDIDLVINKTIVYGVLAAFIAVVYVGVVAGIGTLAGSSGNVLLSAIAAALVALAFQPARRRAQRLADRLVYGKRATPYEILAELSNRFAGAYSLEDALPRLARVVAEGVGARRAVVWLFHGRELRPASSWPAEAAPIEALAVGDGELPAFEEAEGFAVRHQGELLGAVSVSMPPGESLRGPAEKLVSDLASQAGLVLRNVALVENLRASRQRLVTAQDEERRRLERNIHDGAQQQLVALAVKQRLAASIVGQDDERARAMLEELGAETNEALEDLRDLARGIYPPLLADRGLAAALEAQARKSPIPVTVEPDGIGRYAEEVEAAVYFSCLEALQNVAKYAHASSAVINLRSGGGELVFEVIDDGVGFVPASTGYGTGLQGMADRLAALDGALEVRSSPGDGTTVAGSLPALGEVSS